MCNISKQDICVQGEEVTSVVKWKGVIWDFVYAIILPVFERCKVLIMFSGMICDGVCKMELYCERCYFVFEKRYGCRSRRVPRRSLGTASLLEEKPTPSALVFPAKFLKLEVQMSVRQLILDMGKN